MVPKHTRPEATSVYDARGITLSVRDLAGAPASGSTAAAMSRAEAKRVLAAGAGTSRVVLCFSGVDAVGQAFADETFRVFANAHPDVELVVTDAVPEVQQMIRRAEVLRDEQGGQLPLLK